MIFSEKLRTLLDEHELTQKQLASDLKIPPSTLGGYVQGTSEPDFEIFKRIASYFHVSADYLLDMPEQKTDDAQEAELLRLFRSLSPTQKELYLEQGKAFIHINAREKKKSSSFPAKTKNAAG